MEKNSKYAIIIIVVIIVIVSLGTFVANSMVNTIKEEVMDVTVSSENSTIADLGFNGTFSVFKYGNFTVAYLNSEKEVNALLSFLENNENLTQVDTNSTQNITMYQLKNGKYGMLIVNSNNSEAVFVESTDKNLLIRISENINFKDGKISYN